MLVIDSSVTSINCKQLSLATGENIATTLGANDYKEPQAVAYGVDCYNQTQAEEVTQPLRSINADNDHVPCVYGLDRASFNQGQNAKYDFAIESDLSPTILAKGPGGGGSDQVIGALCARDYKGVGNQYVNEGKVVIQKVGSSTKR
jgi:hypothetical protein